MKVRRGFVSNSSSCSFTCDICNRDISGWDMCLSEAEMYECQNEHCFCYEHEIDVKVTREIIIEMLKKDNSYTHDWKKREINMLESMNEEELSEWWEGEGIEEYGVPSEMCPVCNFQSFTNNDLLMFMLCETKKTKKEYREIMKKKFKNYDEFLEYCGSEKI